MSSSRDDSNRIIIAVTGANGGLGLGYCHRILKQLSTEPSVPPPDALEIPVVVGQSSTKRLPSADPSVSKYTTTLPPPTLTLILACRSRQRAESAIKDLKKQHELGLIGRKMRGHKERQGWLEGLEIVFEELDVDRVGGRGGVLDFSERIKNNYPHLTTLVLNAGIGSFTGINWPGAFRQLSQHPVDAVLNPNYVMQEVGRKSGDGLRGGVWGVNVLSTYILAKELHSHLLRSPNTLPMPSRIIYVTSSQGKPTSLSNPPSSDPQLLDAKDSYGASKYIGSIVTSRLDWEMSQSTNDKEFRETQGTSGRKVRMLRLDPGVVHTGMFAQWLPLIMEWMMVVTFYIARWSGSRPHVISTDNSALGLTYLTLTPDSTLEPALAPVDASGSQAAVDDREETETSSLLQHNHPAPSMYLSQSWRTGRPFVGLERVKDWDRFGAGLEGGDGFLDECEREYKVWKAKRSEGMDGIALQREANLNHGYHGDTGVKTD